MTTTSKKIAHANETTMVHVGRASVVVVGRSATIIACLACGEVKNIINYADDEEMYTRIKNDAALRSRCQCHKPKLPPCTCIKDTSL